MVSFSDKAKQLSAASFKQDGTDVAFRTPSGNKAHDVFKEIFDKIAQAKDDNAAPNKITDKVIEKSSHRVSGKTKRETSEAAETTTDDKKVKHSFSHVNKKRDAAKADTDDKQDAVADIADDKTAPAVAAKSDDKKSTKTDASEENPDIEACDTSCVTTADEAADLIDTSTAFTAQADETVSVATLTSSEAAQTATPSVVINPLIVVQLTSLATKPFAALKADTEKNEKINLPENLPENLNDILPSELGGNIKTDEKTVDVKSAKGKDSAAPQTAHPDATLTADETAQFKDLLTKDLQLTADVKKDTLRQAGNKHSEILDLLQGQNPASPTPPATSDRAISVALKTTDSSAPSPNGSAGGGSPIIGKSETSSPSQGLVGFDSVYQNTNAAPLVNGAAAGVKEVKASMMLPTEQVAVHLNHMAKHGIKGERSQYDLQLHPAELGRVDVRLDISKDGAVQATITADNQQAFDMLQKDSRALERALQQAGLQTDSNSLNFSLRQGGDQTQQQAQNNSGNSWNKWQDKILPEETKPSKIITFDINGNTSRVDMRV